MRSRDAEDEARIRDWNAEHAGLLDPDQPTETAHVQHRRRMLSEFTPYERAAIRNLIES